MVNGVRMFNDEIGFCGEPDFTGKLLSDKEGVATVFDIKRTPSKIKDGIQLAAYCNLVKAGRGMIIPLNDKTEQGYSKPTLYSEKEIAGYFNIFLEKRKNFKLRYGV
jgi:hypothetical protein